MPFALRLELWQSRAMQLILIWVLALLAGAPTGCVSGVLTRHDAINQVLANKPWRVCSDCDTYLARPHCGESGARYVGFVEGKRLEAAVVDCQSFSPKPVLKAGEPWLGDMDGDDWRTLGLADRPVKATICPSPFLGRWPFVADDNGNGVLGVQLAEQAPVSRGGNDRHLGTDAGP